MGILQPAVAATRAALRSRAALAAENLRQQLAALYRPERRTRLRRRDRIFWVWLSRIWGNWRSALLIVQPKTVIGRHRQGFKLYWKRKSRCLGRPKTEAEIRRLIRLMSQENPTMNQIPLSGNGSRQAPGPA